MDPPEGVGERYSHEVRLLDPPTGFVTRRP